MSWKSLDDVFNAADQEAERKQVEDHKRRLKAIDAEVDKTRPKHETVVYQHSHRSRRNLWRAECSCGWKVSTETEEQAWEEESWH
jgi:hypothetical protein